MSKSAQLVFFGSGSVGLTSVKALSEIFEIEAVITKPDPKLKRSGEAPVATWAKEHNIHLEQPDNTNSLTALFSKADFKSRIGVVVDYGLIIAKPVIDYFPLGIVNSHFSLLPEWRGPDPITFALLSGQDVTGVSLMLIEPTLDTGQLLAQAEYNIDPGETIGTLTDNLVDLSNQTLKEVLPLYLNGKIVPINQASDREATYSRKLTKADGLIDLTKPAEQIEREIRAYQGWPKSRIKLFGHDVIVLKSRLAKDLKDGDLVLELNPGYLEIQKLIAPSGRTMSGADFLRGYASN